MKKLSKILLQNAEVLENNEMKAIYGGSGGLGGDGICMAVGDYSSSGGMALCTNSADRAIRFAGESGWWCCNCQEAINRCGAHLN